MADTISDQKVTYNLSSLPGLASQLLNEGSGESIWLFYGDLGAGKTTLIKEICIQLGVNPDDLSSPTFGIVNEYQGQSTTIYHFDFYRVKNEIEIWDLGIEEYFDSGNLCLIEWPERLGSLQPDQFFKISISHTNNSSRVIEFEKHA